MFIIRRKPLLAANLFLLVALFPLLLGLAQVQSRFIGPGDPDWFAFVFIPLCYWFYLPALIFGERFFVFGIGVGPRGWEGWLLTVCFYTVIALMMWLPFGIIRRKAIA